MEGLYTVSKQCCLPGAKTQVIQMYMLANLHFNPQELGIALTEDEVELLLEELDKDGDGEINYR